VSLVRIRSSWSPAVRYAARAYRREVTRAQRRFEKRLKEGSTEGEAASMLCAEEAQAVISMLRRLGYGGGKLRGRARDRVELELQVHELDVDVSLNFFRAYLAQRKDQELVDVFSRKGRERTKGKADEIRLRHIQELRASLRARELVREWLGLYYGRLELGKKYREFSRIQFDDKLDEDARLSYLGLLITQLANRSGRPREEILAEYQELAKALVGPPELGGLPEDIPGAKAGVGEAEGDGPAGEEDEEEAGGEAKGADGDEDGEDPETPRSEKE
jgi:hypothetical protein